MLDTELLSSGAPTVASSADRVATIAALARAPIERVAAAYGAHLTFVADRAPIPGSYWGAPEAGLIGDRVFVRADTPVHSLLHELCHYACMTHARRAALATDAGGDTDEECGVCYLQVLLAGELLGFGRERCLADMDLWGYSFREGSARRWFAGDGDTARRWLLAHDLIDSASRPTFRLRGGVRHGVRHGV